MGDLYQAVLNISFNARAAGESPRWGQRRFAGRAAEFGYRDEYDLAGALVDIAIDNRRGAVGRERVIVGRIADAAGGPVPRSHYALTDDAIRRLLEAADADAVAFAACERIALDAIARGVPIPEPLRDWASEAIRGATGPDRRKAKSAFNSARDDAVRFAVRLAMESGAFSTATRSAASEHESACEFVATRMADAGMGVARGHKRVAAIWGGRDKTLDTILAEKK